MGQCLNCQKPIEEYTGRRPKKYCGGACRQKYFQAKNKKKVKKSEATIVPAEAPKEPENMFMGFEIPDGLEGLRLAVWKNEIKMGKKKK